MCRVDVPLIFKNVRRRKKVYNKCKSEKIPKADSAPRNILKWSFLSKLLTTLNCKLFLRKSTILDVSQVPSSPTINTTTILVTINQIILRNNKRAISRFFGTIALTNKPRFYLFKINNRNTKNIRPRCEICLELTVSTTECRQ